MTVGELSRAGVEGLPQSFGDYRPAHGALSQDYADEMPPPRFNDLDDSEGFKDYAAPNASIPEPTVHGGPMHEPPGGSKFYQPPPLPTSMLNEGGREKDMIFQSLMESEGGQDRAAAINTPLIKERPTGVQPHMLAPSENSKINVETDQGDFEGEPLENGMRQGMGKCTYENGNVYNGMWKNNKRRESPAVLALPIFAVPCSPTDDARMLLTSREAPLCACPPRWIDAMMLRRMHRWPRAYEIPIRGSVRRGVGGGGAEWVRGDAVRQS